ncbi:MAG: hypothetical protein CMK09_06685 [Ponticaulis sp.]|nr:hypothetical protein [Ponticaulis sp.]|tara:strand:+ start:16357 stop:16959 length:603 start_codon:yes stop_codon:yes gene_type:complete
MPLTTLFVFTKPNRIGLSKTRLAREIGPVEAARMNAMSTSRVMKSVDDARWQTALCVAPDLATETREPLWPSQLPRLPQGHGDLGDRLSRAYELAPPGNVLFVGTDMPDLKPQDIWTAIKGLRRHDTVIGPANDGGFWLIGLRKRVGSRAPFNNVRWSSEHTLSDVLKNCEGQSVGRLSERTDLDTSEDLTFWRSQHSSS